MTKKKPQEEKQKTKKQLRKVISKVNFWRSGTGYLTMGITFRRGGESVSKEDKCIKLPHMDEYFNITLLSLILGKARCDMEGLKGKPVLYEPADGQEKYYGRLSFDDGKTWLDIDAEKKRLCDLFHKNYTYTPS